MEAFECIVTRRSIRSFTEQPVSEETIKKLLEAVRWAPSWANTQCWEVVVLKERENKEKLAGMVSKNNPAIKGIKQAPAVFVVCCKKGVSGFKSGAAVTVRGDWYMFDAGIACQNLCLAAHALGLGTVHVGSFAHEAVDEFLGLPGDVKSVEIIPVGYPAREGKAPPRKELGEFCHLERYGDTYF
jgi:nitroreductase